MIGAIFASHCDMKTLFTTILLFSITILAQAGESFIPLQKGVRLAADDLVYEDNVLTSREAQDLSDFKNVDLSLLEPKPPENGIWSPEKSVVNDQDSILLEENETLNYVGSLNSVDGLYRFNVSTAGSSKIYTIHIDKALHTLLLRKNILRKLGYIIPPTKYLKKVSIQFNSVEEREDFLKKRIPDNTSGAADRWVKNVSELTLDLYDMAVTEPSENDYYNSAMGVPNLAFNSRVLRSLLIPYAILDLKETVNQFSWIAGKIDNRAAVLPHFTGNNFATTIEDAQWILRKFNSLSRAEIKEAVDLSYFPKGVDALVLEKIISRRNSLNRLLSEKAGALPVDQKLTIEGIVKKGVITKTDFPGYASRFAYGDAESPFEQLRYFLYAKLQSNVLDNAINKFNSYLKTYDLNKTRSDFFKKQFEDGLNHFIETGELIPIGIGTWSQPMFGGQLIFSRDIVLGNYLGTDNIVQLADTFGGSVELGFNLGIEGLGNNLAGNFKASTSVVRTFTHIKPVRNLKESLKEPYKNMFVSLLKSSLKEDFFNLSELKNSTEASTVKAKKIQTLFKEIDKYLGTGESLIMTDRLMPSVDVKVNFNNGLLGVGIGAGANVTTIKRIQIYKKSPEVLQIYDDNGFVTDINMSFQVSEYISLLKITGKLDKGHYNIKSYIINLSSDLEKNPNFYSSALGVYNVLKNKDFEILDSIITPVKIKATFKDRALVVSLLLWKLKAIRGKTYYDLEGKEGINGTYFSLNKDFMTGTNAESFTKQIANYYLTEPTKGDVTLATESDANPGDSFFGRSYTKSVRFEASLDANRKFERKFLSVSDSKQGWVLSTKRVKKMMAKLNEKFQAIIFDTAQIDFDKLRLFKIGYHINLYDRGIERLNNLNTTEIDAIEARYKVEKGCIKGGSDYRIVDCADLETLRYDIKKCKKEKDEEDLAACNIKFIDDLLDLLDFNDFKNLIGVDNIYVYGTIDGFRHHSEILNDTIYSNTVGKIGSREWNGPLNVVRDLFGLSGGEFTGSWLRESI